MEERILHVIKGVVHKRLGGFQVGDLIITICRFVFVGYATFESKGNFDPRDAFALTHGLVGGVLVTLDKLSTAEEEIRGRAMRLAAVWPRADKARGYAYGMTLDERIKGFSCVQLPRIKDSEIKWNPERQSVIFRAGPYSEEFTLCKSEQFTIRQLVGDGAASESRPSYDLTVDSQGFALPFKSPRALLKTALDGDLVLDDRTVNALAQNENYICALGLQLFILARPRRLLAAERLVKRAAPLCSPVSNVVGIFHDERSTKQGRGVFLVVGLVFAAGAVYEKSSGSSWLTVLVFALLGGLMVTGFIVGILDQAFERRSITRIQSVLCGRAKRTPSETHS